MHCDRPLEDWTAEIKFGFRPNYGFNIGFKFGLRRKSQTESYRHFKFCIN